MFIVERLISVIAPHECVGCGQEGSLLCAWCQAEQLMPLPDRCYRCKRLSTDSLVCQACRKIVCLRHVWVATEYQGLIKTLVQRFKFGRAAAAAQPLAIMMANILPYLDRQTIVTHIPTATSRRRQRGYDQAALLARALAQQLGLSYRPLLARLGQTRQVGASRENRLKQLQSAFRPINRSHVKGAQVLIVDDILTTGGTIEAAAKVLHTHGARVIDAAVFAQKH